MEKILLLTILFSMSKQSNTKGLVAINEYISNLQIDPKYTEEKINLARKIAPLMPPEYFQPISRSIYITESLVRIMELNEFMNKKSLVVEAAHIPVEDNRERLTRIVSVIQEEVPRSNMQNIGTVLEFVTNMDKYKKMFELLNIFMKNQNNIGRDPDKLAKMMEPMMKARSSQEGEGSSLDIEKIMNIMSLLNKPKEKSSEAEIQSSDRRGEKNISKEVLPIELKETDENLNIEEPENKDKPKKD